MTPVTCESSAWFGEYAAGERVVKREVKRRSQARCGSRVRASARRRESVEAAFPALDSDAQEMIPRGQFFAVRERVFGERLQAAPRDCRHCRSRTRLPTAPPVLRAMCAKPCRAIAGHRRATCADPRGGLHIPGIEATRPSSAAGCRRRSIRQTGPCMFDGFDVGIDAAVCGPNERGQVGGALDGGNRAAALPRRRHDVFQVPQHHVVTDCGALDAPKSVAHLACQLLQAGQNIVK